jgi:transcriptional regulator with XRE-family HTH domain
MAARLGAAAREGRETAGLSLLDIATTAGVSQTTIHRFELGDGWRRQTDQIVNAYARELGVDAEDLWKAALERRD